MTFHKAQRPVLTASMEQVRQPIYANSIHRWQHYSRHLEPLRKAMGV